MSSRPLENEQLESIIINLLKAKGEMTLWQIEQEINKINVKCPDGVARFLSKMRLNGKIQGKVSVEKKGWVWWLGK